MIASVKNGIHDLSHNDLFQILFSHKVWVFRLFISFLSKWKKLSFIESDQHMTSISE